MKPLTILHLHRMGDPAFYRESVYTLEHMIRVQAPQSVCFVHDADLPLPAYVKLIEFDLIVLGPTFLCVRYDEALLSRVKDAYGFIAHSPACKIALPQDDYDCSAILDRWMVDWGVDFLYTICPSGWDVLYPEFQRHGTIRLGFTGYISDAWVEQWRQPRDHADRVLDVVYRAAKLPANFGSVGQLKSDIVERFERALPAGALRTDVSVDPEKMIPGKAWHGFLESSRACLITPSGSSLLDSVGLFRKRSADFVRTHSMASFDEISAACFPGEDGKHIFTMISPRNIEAALGETVQIAIPSDYSGLLAAGDHYIPLAPDCSNIADVLRTLRDPVLMKTMAARCKEAVLSHHRLRARAIVDELLTTAAGFLELRHALESDPARYRSLLERYEREVYLLSQRHWSRQRLLTKTRHWLKRAGMARVRDFFTR
jgi:hypothetical protein